MRRIFQERGYKKLCVFKAWIRVVRDWQIQETGKAMKGQRNHTYKCYERWIKPYEEYVPGLLSIHERLSELL